MKRIPALFLAAVIVTAQAADPAQPAGTAEHQKLSYAIGVLFARNLQLETPVDHDSFLQGIRDVMTNAQLKYPAEELKLAVDRYREEQMKLQNESAKTNLEEGKKFMEANKGKDGVVTTASGLQYKVMIKGTGAIPKPSDTVTVHYRGTLLNGKEFDSSYSRGQPAPLQVNGVIKGWQEALSLMPVGSKWTVWVPPQLAYGDRAVGPDIQPNSTLVFEIELLQINK